MRRALTRALALLAGPWTALAPRSLRVLAYHGVSDSESFRRQMAYLAGRFAVIGPDTLSGSRHDGRPPMWITFDDGDPSVVDDALPVLDDFGFHATLFVCPGVVDTAEPYWWQVVAEAAGHGLTVDGEPVTDQLISRLKQVSDAERVDTVRAIGSELEAATGRPFQVAQLTSEQLTEWVEAGNTVGNHTWDHPLLNHCDPSVQREQIVRAHDWLLDRVAPEQLLFAYPNGNWTEVAEAELRALGYQYAFLFDHRVAKLDNPLRVSRIRVNAHDDLVTFIARVSGLHPAIHHALRRA